MNSRFSPGSSLTPYPSDKHCEVLKSFKSYKSLLKVHKSSIKSTFSFIQTPILQLFFTFFKASSIEKTQVPADQKIDPDGSVYLIESYMENIEGVVSKSLSIPANAEEFSFCTFSEYSECSSMSQSETETYKD